MNQPPSAPGYDRRLTMLCRSKPTRGDCGSFPAAADLTPGYERPRPLDPPPLRSRDRGQRKPVEGSPNYKPTVYALARVAETRRRFSGGRAGKLSVPSAKPKPTVLLRVRVAEIAYRRLAPGWYPPNIGPIPTDPKAHRREYLVGF